MSLHAQPSPEAIRALKNQQRTSRATSVLIATLSILAVGLILMLIGLETFTIARKPTVIVPGHLPEDPPLTPPKTASLVRNTSAPSNAAPLIIPNVPSNLSLPKPDFVPLPASPGFGESAGDGIGGDGIFGPPGDPGDPNIPTPPGHRCSKAERLARLKETGGTAAVDDAVANTLRWLQRNQNADGSWGQQHKVGMTGLALLAYLGRCETPVSAEFGESCTLGIVHLLDIAAKHDGRMATDFQNKHWPYEHAIATYALAEALSLAPLHGYSIPGHREAVRQAGQWIIDNQHQSGGWDYAYDESGSRGGDLSVAGWHLQALKACHTTGLKYRNLRPCIKRGLEYVEAMQGPNGGFGYTGPAGGKAHPSLTGVGALCLQIWDKDASRSTRDGIKNLRTRPAFAYGSEWSDLYAHYYASQALLRAGGKSWTEYNASFAPELLAAQQEDGGFPVPGAGQKLQAVAPLYMNNSQDGLVYRNALCALMLEVYYRYLPATGR